MNIKGFVKAVVESIDAAVINIDINKSFVENGGYSLAAVRLSDIVYQKTQIVLNFFDIMGDESIQALFNKLSELVVSDQRDAGDFDEGVL